MHTIRNIILLFGVCFLFSFSNFFYDDDDWYIIKNPNQIQSFTDDNYRIIIGTVNGIFTYDKITKELLYDSYLTRGLPSKNIKHIYYDRNTDHIWVIHDEGVSYKPITSFSYQHLSTLELLEKGLSFIDDIGSSSNYIWLRKNSHVIAINPFSGRFVPIDDSNYEINDISWGSSMYGYDGQDINISKYYSSNPNWSIGYRVNNLNNQYIDYNVFFDEYGDQVVPTVFFKDLDDNIWIGTDSGYLFNAWRNSSKLDMIESGIQRGIISGAHIDDEFNWWFYDSYYKRTAQIVDMSFKNNDNNFLTYWNEKEGYWKKYKTNESIEIKNSDVNDLMKYDNYILIGTMYGLLKHELDTSEIRNNKNSNFNNNWELLDATDGLYDNAIWKIENCNDRFFILTSNGINEISLSPYTVIPNTFEDFKNMTILDMNIFEDKDAFICDDSQSKYNSTKECNKRCNSECVRDEISQIILSTTKGLVSIDLETNMETFLSSRVCSQIEIQGFNLFCLNNGIARTNLIEKTVEFENIIFNETIRNFTVSDHYLWINLIDRAHLKDLNNGESWYYGENDGIQGNNIYEIGNIDDWVYFISDEGISLYNWRKFHAN